jgi:putative oxidoreductase
MNARQVLFGMPEPRSATADFGLLVYRLAAGLAIALLHGLGKVPPSEGFVGMLGGMGLPAPGIMAWLAMFAEFGGGLLLAAGLLTRPIAFVLVGHFLVVVLMGHAGQPVSDRELPLLFLATAVLFLFAGAGRFSLDAAIGGRRR